MPQAVSTVSAATSGGAPARASTFQPNSADGENFRDTLGRAQNKNSAPDSSGQDASQNAAASEKPAAKTASSATSAAGEKVSGKKGARQANDSDPTPGKKVIGKDQGEVKRESDPKNSENSRKGDPSSEGKPQKKGSVKAVADPTLSPDAIVQIQGNGAVPTPTNAGGVPPETGKDVATSSQVTTTGQTSAVTTAVDGSSPEAKGQPAQVAATTDADGDTSGADLSSPTVQPKVFGASQPGKSRGASEKGASDGANDSVNPAAVRSQIADAALGTAIPSDNSTATAPTPAEAAAPIAKAAPKALGDTSLNGITPNQPAATNAKAAFHPVPDTTPTPPEAQFAEANRARIITGIKGELLPNGGSMQLLLDPADLGPLQVHVEMKDGVMTASFETSNDQAAKLLSHSLGDLKTALEAQGVTVEKLHVAQAPKQQSSSGDSRQGASEQGQNTASQQEQQRKEMMRRMWRKLMNGQDPIDLVA